MITIPLAQRIMNDYQGYIIKKFHGKDALDKAKKIFFEDKKEAQKWSNQWSNYQKSKAVLFFYEKGNKVGFKFIIGDSVLGEKYTTNKGKEILKNL